MFKWLKKFFFGSNKKNETQVPTTMPAPTSGVSPEDAMAMGKKMDLWATFYYSKVLEDTMNPTDEPLLDMAGKKLGPYLKQKDWCLAGIEGTAFIDGVTYNYAGTGSKSQTSCGYRGAEKTRWKKSPYKFGIGNRNNPLEPYVSLATDQSIIPFGSRVFIPEAVGIEFIVDGVKKKHDGFFRVDDVGGAIKGNHVDVFIGNVKGGLEGALEQNPFSFIKNNSSKTFAAYIVR